MIRLFAEERAALEKKIRTFIAFELPADIIRLMEKLQSRLQQHALELRWVRPRNSHLTLKFLGEILPDTVASIGAAMQDAAQGRQPMELFVQGLGLFPGIRKPRVLWAGLGGMVDRLVQMQSRLEEVLEPLGFDRELRPFLAHLTLGRIKGRIDGRRLLQAIQDAGQFAPAAFQARELVLLQSELRPQGARYTALIRQALGDAVEG